MQRTRALVLVSLAELLAMGLWFGVSAVGPQIAAEWRLDEATTAWLTLAVQLGQRPPIHSLLSFSGP